MRCGDGRLLVAGDTCNNRVFRAGPVVGVLFHLEIAAAEVVVWEDAYPQELEQVGKTRRAVIAECHPHDAVMAVLAERFLENFLHAVAGLPRAR